MTKLGKSLVVFVAVMSVAFLAFIGVTTLAGPNWQMKAADLDGYTIEATGGDVVQWKVTERVAGKDLGTKPTLPAAIETAQSDRISAQQNRIGQLDQEIARLQETINAEKPASEQDAAGIQARLAELGVLVGELDQQIVALVRQGTEQAAQAETVRAEAGARRADVARLQNELAQIRTDRYRVGEQIKQLEQRLIRMGGQIDRALRRQQQLRDRTTDYEADARDESRS